MKFPLLWFLAASMTMAFINVAYLHKTPTEALILGLAVGATGTAMEMGLFKRLWQRVFPRSGRPHA
jgi:hypothetical protein